MCIHLFLYRLCTSSSFSFLFFLFFSCSCSFSQLTAFNFFFSLAGRSGWYCCYCWCWFAFFSFSSPSLRIQCILYMRLGTSSKKRQKKNYKHTTKYIKVQTHTGQYESYANALTPDANIQRNPYTHLVLDSLILSHISLFSAADRVVSLEVVLLCINCFNYIFYAAFGIYFMWHKSGLI